MLRLVDQASRWLILLPVLAAVFTIPVIANSVQLISHPMLGNGEEYALTVSVSWSGGVTFVDEVSFGVTGDNVTSVIISGERSGLDQSLFVSIYNGEFVFGEGSGLISSAGTTIPAGDGPFTVIVELPMDGVYYHSIALVEVES